MKEETWYEKLDFFENPFSIKPESSQKIYGYVEEKKELVKKIKAGNINLIQGDFGLGKTTILKHLIKVFGGKKKLVYVSCNRYDNDLDIDSVIMKSGGVVSRLMKRRKRGLILLLDEVHELSEDELSEIYEAYMDNYFKSIVCISTEPDEINFPEEMLEKVKKNVIELKGISEENAINIVRDRVGEIELMSDDIIKAIYAKSGNNPRRFLANCEDVSRFAIDSGSKTVENEHLEILKA